MLAIFKRLGDVFRKKGCPPLLFRFRTANGFVEGAIELEMTWQPSGKRWRTVSRAAQGLCIIPWAGGHRVEIDVAHPAGRARVSADAQDAFAGEARVVYLS